MWAGFDETNESLKNDPTASKSRLMDHLKDDVPAIGHRVIEWDAINHPASWSPSNRIDSVLGPSLCPDIMRHARSLGSVPMWLNEDQLFRPGHQQEEYYQSAKIQRLSCGCTEI